MNYDDYIKQARKQAFYSSLMNLAGGLMAAGSPSRAPGGNFAALGQSVSQAGQNFGTAQSQAMQQMLMRAKMQQLAQGPKPIIRDFKMGDKFVTKQSFDNGRTWVEMGKEYTAPRYKPGTTVNVNNQLGFKPLTELGKLQSDYQNLRKNYGPEHPATRAAKQKIETYGLSSKTKGELEKTAVDARAGLERIKGIAKQFDPSYQTFPTRILNWTRAIREKAGADLPPDQKQALAKFTTFQRETIQNLNLYIRSITGAQLSEHEAGRIMKGMPNLDDSPTQFKAKLNSTIRELEAAITRSSGQRQGVLTGPGAPTRKKKTILRFDAQGNLVK